ncbi:MAG: hypothetical protein U9Q70_01520, partial [Chloroflexota bacterium]|nr:hypothetical protein [Chloroflexota bacterium]
MAATKQLVDVGVQHSLFSGQRSRHLREALQAYLFLLPGTLILFIFSLFPIGYALYISFHKWRIRKGDFIGFGNYLKALGTPKDTIFTLGGLGLLAGSWMLWRKIKSEDSTKTMLFKVLLAFLLIVGGLGLVLGFPQMLGNGDEDLFMALLITSYYSLGTVPFQIVLSFLLAT